MNYHNRHRSTEWITKAAPCGTCKEPHEAERMRADARAFAAQLGLRGSASSDAPGCDLRVGSRDHQQVLAADCLADAQGQARRTAKRRPSDRGDEPADYGPLRGHILMAPQFRRVAVLAERADLGIEGVLLSGAKHGQFGGRLTVPVAAQADR